MSGTGKYCTFAGMHKTRLIFVILLITVGCSRYPAGVEHALNLAGNNRAELEQVLVHYLARPEDSLKYRAACFLIGNMPEKYAIHSKKLEQFKTNLYPIVMAETCAVSIAFEKLEKEYGVFNRKDFQIKYDLYEITADYLIQNIEWSFKVWDETPWGKLIPFDDFCESILPYRIGNEPLENWRETYYGRFRPMLDELSGTDNLLKACQAIYDTISNEPWIFDTQLNLPSLGANVLLTNRLGGCHDRCDLMVYAMRSVGIPCGIDLIIQSPEKRNPHHYWNYTKLENGTCIEFAHTDMRPDTVQPPTHYKKGKIYRECFAKQITPTKEELPQNLANKYAKDVSKEYYPGESVEVPVKHQIEGKNLMFLCVFNNREWIPIGWTTIKDGKATFSHIEQGNLYIAAYFMDDELHLASDPFIYWADNTRYMLADTTQCQEITLNRKYPFSDYVRSHLVRMLDGKFQASSRQDFTDAKTLHRIGEVPDPVYQVVTVSDKNKYRYIRYLSGKDGHGNIAEIEFYGDNDKPLSGKVIGTTPPYANHPDFAREKAFDKDPLTFFSANEPNGAWTGLALDIPERISKIRYLGRNDDNGIREGDLYELVYFLDSEWKSLGKQVATDIPYLRFSKVPVNALFLLHNHTRGIEERPFTYENGKQVWW